MNCREYIRSDKWQTIASHVRRRDRFRCRRCGRRGYQVHHKHYAHLGAEDECGYCCLQTLCAACHRAAHGIEDHAPSDEQLYALMAAI
jgi:5-methylcytosine-specific restriction endonuclease McrA